ncbi:Arginosuccinate synthase [Bartonella sp. AR 15-3]|nr:Arginosuccinate synthase [Bartonella sp. AR 15-3]CBI78535.1 hypothetical protein BAR15_10021 [Bartonella sp. AR 15-3]
MFPIFRVNAVYEGVYLLGTSIARLLISKRLVEIAQKTNVDAIAHGATGKAMIKYVSNFLLMLLILILKLLLLGVIGT